jgi:hypothetical protein
LTLKPKEDSRRAGNKRSLWGRSERHFIPGREGKSILLLEGSQAVLVRPSDNDSQIEDIRVVNTGSLLSVRNSSK